VHLVLQAGLLPEARGRIAALEMGQPIRIVELARNLVRLSGLRPEVDIRFEYTGLRPGEKLHETLVGPDEQLVPTRLSNVRLIEGGTNVLGVRLAAVLSEYHRERALTSPACLAWLTDFVLGRTRTSPSQAARHAPGEPLQRVATR
jgi:FlaA1/EpsC-like NDP-sugar epimerase